MRWSTRSLGKPNAPTRIANRMTRFATLSNISAKNAFASPARNQELRGTVVALSKCAGRYHEGARIPGVPDRDSSQLDLFAAPPSPRRPSPLADRLERERAEAAAVAARLPPGVRFGTSSWSFPDWAGLVYSRVATVAELAREGLREYGRHPLLATVGIDRSYYAPIPPEDLVRYAAQLPPGFLCCAKALETVTSGAMPARARSSTKGTNPHFLNPRLFVDEMVGPFGELFREHTGPFLLQFPPVPVSLKTRPGEFAEKLGLGPRQQQGGGLRPADHPRARRDPGRLSGRVGGRPAARDPSRAPRTCSTARERSDATSASPGSMPRTPPRRGRGRAAPCAR